MADESRPPHEAAEPDRSSFRLDLAPLVRGWDYEAGEVTARKILDAAGRIKIQMRIPLGILQMEVEGRPDGRQPHGYDSILEFHEMRFQRHKEENGSEQGFELSQEDCDALRDEATLYYYRYLCFFRLRDFEGAARDTQRNLKALNLIRAYASSDSDTFAMEQFRPYVLMMNARARAYLALDRARPDEGVRIVTEAIAQIRETYGDWELLDGLPPAETLIESSAELRILEEFLEEIHSPNMKTQISAKEAGFTAMPEPGPVESAERPAAESKRRERKSKMESLQAQLREAVEKEDFSRAAQLRDLIRELRG